MRRESSPSADGNDDSATTRAPSAARSERLTRAILWSVSALFVLFILGASFIPAGGELVWAKAEARRFLSLPSSLGEVFATHDLRDVATNVLLYLPLGVFVGLALAVGRARLSLLSPGLLAGPLLSLAVELTQGLTNRVSDVVDLATNSTGHLLGFAITAIAVNRLRLRPALLLGLSSEQHDSLSSRADTLSAVRFIYICVYLVVALLPFHISVSISRLYAQLQPATAGADPLLILDPLYRLHSWPRGSLGLLISFLGLVPVGALSALVAAHRHRFSPLSPIVACVIVALVAEGLKLFNLARTSDVAVPLVAIGSGLAGLGLAQLWLRLSHQEQLATTDQRAQRLRLVVLACVGYALAIALLAWYPYTFETSIEAIFHKLRHESNLLPLRAHFAERSLGAAIDLIKETGIYVPFGLLLALLTRELRPQLGNLPRLVVVAAVCWCYAAFIELTQAMCIERFVDVTDLFLAALGGVIGVGLTRLVSRQSRA